MAVLAKQDNEMVTVHVTHQFIIIIIIIITICIPPGIKDPGA